MYTGTYGLASASAAAGQGNRTQALANTDMNLTYLVNVSEKATDSQFQATLGSCAVCHNRDLFISQKHICAYVRKKDLGPMCIITFLARSATHADTSTRASVHTHGHVTSLTKPFLKLLKQPLNPTNKPAELNPFQPLGMSKEHVDSRQRQHLS